MRATRAVLLFLLVISCQGCASIIFSGFGGWPYGGTRVDGHIIATLGEMPAERKGAWVVTAQGHAFRTEDRGRSWIRAETPPTTVAWDGDRDPRHVLAGFDLAGLHGETPATVDDRPFEYEPSVVLTMLAAVDLAPSVALDTAILPYSFLRWALKTCAFQQ